GKMGSILFDALSSLISKQPFHSDSLANVSYELMEEIEKHKKSLTFEFTLAFAVLMGELTGVVIGAPQSTVEPSKTKQSQISDEDKYTKAGELEVARDCAMEVSKKVSKKCNPVLHDKLLGKMGAIVADALSSVLSEEPFNSETLTNLSKELTKHVKRDKQSISVKFTTAFAVLMGEFTGVLIGAPINQISMESEDTVVVHSIDNPMD
ncbi:hypothetical protein PFISCL1PPCAC_24549, partial [Pristionchus fissidentatus]